MTNEALTSPDDEGTTTKDRLVFLFLHFVGHIVQVQLKDGTIYEGVCSAIAKDEFSVIICGARLKTSKIHPNGAKHKTKPKDMLHIPAAEVHTLVAQEVSFGGERTFAEGGFVTDADITRGDFKGGMERQLQSCNFLLGAQSGQSLEMEIENHGKNTGWDQFSVNQKLFGYKSTWDETLYTTKLDSTKVTPEMEKEAARLAKEIERGEGGGRMGDHINQNIHVMIERNQALERDYDEEELHSSVIRADPRPQGSRPATGGEAVPMTGKYVPPHKRGSEPAHKDSKPDAHHFQHASDFLTQAGECGPQGVPVPPSAVSVAEFEKQLLDGQDAHKNPFLTMMASGSKISWADTVEDEEAEADSAQAAQELAASQKKMSRISLEEPKKSAMKPLKTTKLAAESVTATPQQPKATGQQSGMALDGSTLGRGKIAQLPSLPQGSFAIKNTFLQVKVDSNGAAPPTKTVRLAAHPDISKWMRDDAKPSNREQEINALKNWSNTLESKLRTKGEDSTTPGSTATQPSQQQQQSQQQAQQKSQQTAQQQPSQLKSQQTPPPLQQSQAQHTQQQQQQQQ
mmetsp:Transcript_63/g.171  ORF Transcript_63/g.171 Transcript_63/m.171 type:complete len:570 (-) Transcript_63:18-1727(-)